MMRTKQEIADDALAESQKWAAALDRSAIPVGEHDNLDVLIALQAIERLSTVEDDYVRTNVSARLVIGDRIDDVLSAEKRPNLASGEYVPVYAEICLWWMLSGDSRLMKAALAKLSETPPQRRVFLQLLEVATDPVERPYLRGGIWDRKLIASFVQAGIDESMARSLMSSDWINQ